MSNLLSDEPAHVSQSVLIFQEAQQHARSTPADAALCVQASWSEFRGVIFAEMPASDALSRTPLR
jgi:hypothetical protein